MTTEAACPRNKELRKELRKHSRRWKGIDTILTGGAFTDYLRTTARFHSCSVGHVALILWQRPDATQVAGRNAEAKTVEGSLYLALGDGPKAGSKSVLSLRRSFINKLQKLWEPVSKLRGQEKRTPTPRC